MFSQKDFPIYFEVSVCQAIGLSSGPFYTLLEPVRSGGSPRIGGKPKGGKGKGGSNPGRLRKSGGGGGKGRFGEECTY